MHYWQLTGDQWWLSPRLVAGKIFENFTLNPGGKVDGGSPPSQPPTPPSTPLSPKSAGDLSNKYTSTTIPNIPNLIITHNSSPNIPQNFSTAQKTPLNLGLKPKTTYANGLQGGEYSFADLEARGKVDDAKMGADQKGGQASRVSTTLHYHFTIYFL